MVAFILFLSLLLPAWHRLFPTLSLTSHWWIPWEVLTSASRCFSIFHCCSARLTEWAGSVFRSSCFSKVTAASYSPSVKSSGRNSPVSPLPFFFPVTCEGRRWRVRVAGLVLGSSSVRMLQEAPGPPWQQPPPCNCQVSGVTHCCDVPGLPSGTCPAVIVKSRFRLD